MSILSDAFQHALNARERVVGVREKVEVDGNDYDALVETISVAYEAVAGGLGNSGGFRCQIATSAFPDGRPEQGAPAIVRDLPLVVLEVEDINGIVYNLIVGDPSTQ